MSKFNYKKSYLTASEASYKRLGAPYKFRGAIVDLDDNEEQLMGNIPDVKDGLMLSSKKKNKKSTEKPLSFLDRVMDFIVTSNKSLKKLAEENPSAGKFKNIVKNIDGDINNV
tara:strand:- start:140 stop:478 length:339 start_codon:yes stop_codon:yes gene_type:complete